MPTRSLATEVKAGISDIKAAYLFNFIRFTDWPENTNTHRAISLQVLASPDVLATMQVISRKNRIAQQLPLMVGSCTTGLCLNQASALFIGHSEQEYLPMLRLLSDKPVLTISDVPGFASDGGMIEMKYINKKITFIVNLKAVKSAGLYISAQLLQFGEILGRDRE
ncbi:MAG: YfiR family protein [Mariprofundus sp.]|nr:YfiR family protein [Mariprofundus sp.]